MSDSSNQQWYIKPQGDSGKDFVSIGSGSTNVGISENHTFNNEVVSHPLEDGSSLFDHVIINPDELEIVIHTGNTPEQSSGSGGPSSRYPSQVLFAQLKKWRNERTVLEVRTMHEYYSDMVISEVSVPNAAPFPGRTDITIKFIRISIPGKFKNIFPRDQFTGESKLSPAQKKQEQKKAMVAAAKGKKQPATDVADAASSIQDLGEQKPEAGFAAPPETDSFEEFENEGILEQLESAYDQAAKTVAQIEGKIAAAYNKADKFKRAVTSKISAVAEKMAIIPNMITGVQSMVFEVAGQVTGLTIYFDVLSGGWFSDIKDSNGEPILSGCLLSPALDILHGIDAHYTDGSSLNLKGMYMTDPYPTGSSNSVSQSAISTTASEVAPTGMEASPYAFTEQENGIRPCSIMFFADENATETYRELRLGDIDRAVNFNIDDMDYTVKMEA